MMVTPTIPLPTNELPPHDEGLDQNLAQVGDLIHRVPQLLGVEGEHTAVLQHPPHGDHAAAGQDVDVAGELARPVHGHLCSPSLGCTTIRPPLRAPREPQIPIRLPGRGPRPRVPPAGGPAPSAAPACRRVRIGKAMSRSVAMSAARKEGDRNVAVRSSGEPRLSSPAMSDSLADPLRVAVAAAREAGRSSGKSSTALVARGATATTPTSMLSPRR